MTIRVKSLFFLFLAVVSIWFIYVERAILHPILWGAIFAFIFNPVVNFFSNKVKIPRSLAVIIIYFVLMTIVVIAGAIVARQLFAESTEIRDFVTSLLVNARAEINTLPDWLQPTVYDSLRTLQKLRIGSSLSLLPFFPQAFSRLISFLIFVFSGYYFLKEGKHIFEKLVTFMPHHQKVDVEILIQKIHNVLGQYLRGQIFLIFLMATATFIPLLLLGVRFALFIAIFSGFGELIPIVGPILAASLAVLVVLVTGHVNFGLTPMSASLIVIAVYFILRHAEDYLVIPHIMGKITKLPPFVIFFAVIAGGNLAGVLGLILAVPVAAVIKLVLEFSFDQLHEKK